MRATECGKEVVYRYSICQIRHLERSRIAPVTFRMKQVIGSDPEIDDVSGLHAIRIVVVVLGAGERIIAALWKRDEF
jgi:hypothetical protein